MSTFTEQDQTATPLSYIADGEKLYSIIEEARKAARRYLRKPETQRLEIADTHIFHDPDSDGYFVSLATGIGAGYGTYEPIEEVTLNGFKTWERRYVGGDRGHFEGESYSVVDVGPEGFNGHKIVWDEKRERLPSFIRRCVQDGLEIIRYYPDAREAYARLVPVVQS